jgi:hypothetical protein
MIFTGLLATTTNKIPGTILVPPPSVPKREAVFGTYQLHVPECSYEHM